MNLKKMNKIIIASISLLLIGILSPVIANDQIQNLSQPYEGHLRLYIVEPTSRWETNNREPYHFGFLDFAFNEMISINYQESYEKSITWDGDSAGYDDIKIDNIMVIAAVFNPEINIRYSDPPGRAPFEAHFVDASAAAIPGTSGQNIVNDEFTHTIFIEQGTAQYCPYCPAMENALNIVYESNEYPFYFTALIARDFQRNVLNNVAFEHLRSSYDQQYYPSAYIDGGSKVVVGGYDDPAVYIQKILQSGQRDVHELDLAITVEWLGEGNLKIDIHITNNEEFFNEPPEKPTISGPIKGSVDVEQTYEISANDPDGNPVFFYIDWGDGSDLELKGPYHSGNKVKIKHIWTEKGTYIIKVQARDSFDKLSEWETLEINVPKTKSYTNIFYRFHENHPIIFDIFWKIFCT